MQQHPPEYGFLRTARGTFHIAGPEPSELPPTKRPRKTQKAAISCTEGRVTNLCDWGIPQFTWHQDLPSKHSVVCSACASKWAVQVSQSSDSALAQRNVPC